MEAIFTCEECSKQFKKKSKLNRHVKETHTDMKPYQCEECQAEFKRNSHLTRHNKLKHSQELKPFVCNVDACFQRFSTKQHLDRHIKIIHFGEKIKCEECDMEFNKKILLAKHLSNVHNKPKPFLCSAEGCDRGFFREIDLSNHKKLTHDNNNTPAPSLKRKIDPLTDNLSTEAFSESFEGVSQNSGLNGTLPIKEKKKKELYVCFYEDCLKAFSKKYNLRNHVKTHHLGICEFVCNQCDAKYKHKKSLQEHMTKRHMNGEINNMLFQKNCV